MRNNEANAPNQETRDSSCPYPLSSDQMPMPPTPQHDEPVPATVTDATRRVNNETVPVGMLSPYYRDHIVPRDNFPLTGLSDEGTELINFRNSNNTLNEEDITLMEQIPVALPIGFKTVDVQMDSTPSAPPPSYNELFAQPEVDGPTAIITETSTIPSDTRSSRHWNNAVLEPIADTRTTPVPRNRTNSNRTEIQSPRQSRTIVVPRHHHVRTNTYQNISDNRTSNSNEYSMCCSTVFKLVMAFIVILVFYYILKAVISARSLH